LISPSNPLEEEVILVDEVLTPDSSCYWPLDKYEPGKSQPSFDKQYVRDWLVSQGYRKGLEKGPTRAGILPQMLSKAPKEDTWMPKICSKEKSPWADGMGHRSRCLACTLVYGTVRNFKILSHLRSSTVQTVEGLEGIAAYVSTSPAR